MDVMVKMARFQIKQNVLNLKSTLVVIHASNFVPVSYTHLTLPTTPYV